MVEHPLSVESVASHTVLLKAPGATVSVVPAQVLLDLLTVFTPPAMEAGISDHVWSPEEIAGLAE